MNRRKLGKKRGGELEKGGGGIHWTCWENIMHSLYNRAHS